jgi:hypothetical protein
MINHEMTSHDATEPPSGDLESSAIGILNDYQDIFAAPTGLPPESREKYQIITDPYRLDGSGAPKGIRTAHVRRTVRRQNEGYPQHF